MRAHSASVLRQQPWVCSHLLNDLVDGYGSTVSWNTQADAGKRRVELATDCQCTRPIMRQPGAPCYHLACHQECGHVVTVCCQYTHAINPCLWSRGGLRRQDIERI